MATHVDHGDGREIRLVENPDGWWTSIDEETGVASQGKTRHQALENLDEAVALYRGEAGEVIEDEATFLEDIGIDPDEIHADPRDLPDFMQ